MPLDNFQKKILSIIQANRAAQSPFAGGSVIQYHGMRLSDDRDIFTSCDPEPIMQRDVKSLEATGLDVHETKSYDNFFECRVMIPGKASAILQWTRALGYEYYSPVPDPDFGQRLHFVHLAANKAIAAGGRMEARDFYDL